MAQADLLVVVLVLRLEHHHQFLLGVLAIDLGQSMCLTAQVLMRHTQEEFVVSGDILSIHRVSLFNLLNDVFDFISCPYLVLTLIDEQGFEPIDIDPDNGPLEATELLGL